MAASGLWHVTLTVGGEAQDAEEVLAALERLSLERPFFLSGRYGRERAELRYWEEAHDCADACALALRVWFEHRESAQLPPWGIVAIEVVARDEHQHRDGTALAPAGGWRPF
ncbi:MAG: hypothetical protein QOJ03_2415 [Frankiaceae bacterium]|jgi:hypothetical protein|nr:hypothetical protein [Frankiaceae bacterium]